MYDFVTALASWIWSYCITSEQKLLGVLQKFAYPLASAKISVKTTYSLSLDPRTRRHEMQT
jgi:hypothetical protein